jgi:hypothetical protein
LGRPLFIPFEDLLRKTKVWTDAEIERLKTMTAGGSSAMRCAAFGKPSTAIKVQARKRGIALPGVRATKANYRAKLAAAESKLPAGSWRNDGTRV